MHFKLTQANGKTIAIVDGKEAMIHTAQEALELIVNCSYQGADDVVIHAQCITPDFFELKTGIAGEMLQKFSLYRMRLAIIGDWGNVSSNSLKDFICESNKHGLINFVATHEDALRIFGQD